ncbi:MAG: EAL domain-containing protein [Sulfurospirillaceae bacterium]|nr:EAL domain-containing protein [Sulfurospirillaceae bacterium]
MAQIKESNYFKIAMMFLLLTIAISIAFSAHIVAYFSIILVAFVLLFLFKKPPKKQRETTSPIHPNMYLKAFEDRASIAKISADFTITYVNRMFSQTVFKTKEECLGLGIFALLEQLFAPESTIEEIQETLKYNQSWEGMLTLKTQDGSMVSLNCSMVPLIDEESNIIEYLFIANDFTELVISQKNLKQNIYTDQNTKLPNRLKFLEDKKDSLSTHELTFILINIDSFQEINSLYGNSFGDAFLKTIALWLRANLPLNQKANLYKFEADIYAIFIKSAVNEFELDRYLKKLTFQISRDKLTCKGLDINISFTMGAVQATKDLLKLSMIAYKEAKKHSISYVIYDKKSDKEQEYTRNIQMGRLLKEALNNDDVVPFFQPIMNLKNNKIEKHETLMRIRKKEGGFYLPFEFLEVAKHSKIYPKLSMSLIQKTFEMFQMSSREFSINLSFLDMANPATTEFIFKKLEEFNLGPWVIFEILESDSSMENYGAVLKFIEQVKSYGAKIAIDDFGSGYSNFERLMELRVDYIKIDGSLIKTIDQNEDMRIVVQTIVNFAKELKIQTVAEYVHSHAVLKCVKDIGIDFAQGFYIGRPTEEVIDTPQEHL